MTIYHNDQYCFNFKHFDLLEILKPEHLVFSPDHKILIADRMENCQAQQVLGLFIDVLDHVYAVRALEDRDITGNPKISEWILFKREVFDQPNRVIETETVRFSFDV